MLTAQRCARLIIASITTLVATIATAIPSHASLIWDGDASRGTGVFGNIECPSPGSVSTVTDSSRGQVFRYRMAHGIDRCESRNVRVNGYLYHFSSGSTYYLRWSNKLSTTSGDFVTWQWKSYPNGTQNYPLIMTVKNGNVRLFYVPPNGASWVKLWERPVQAMQWNDFVVGIRTSTSSSTGWVELWHNGQKQTLINGATRYNGRTWDGDNEPKWGVYDSGNPEGEKINYIDGLRIGTSYSDVS